MKYDLIIIGSGSLAPPLVITLPAPAKGIDDRCAYAASPTG
ncbi:Uncharacterised protein [Salmonella enterica subsp. arizonae]|uniref:Uncharacterized protein n=1 Tax=Salmonella enterica subsp. arizonae TaxID=59203 RepID=A0A2X4WFL6_SALER|nr:Uncharacterised protein [Salmonella enterica subsp. arizonae]